MSQRQIFDGQPSVFAAATRLPQCSGPVRGETRHCAVQEPHGASHAESFLFRNTADTGKVFSLCDNSAFCAFSERTWEDKAGCQQTVELPRVRAPAANVDICMYFAFSQCWEKNKKKCIKKHIALFIFHTACNDINTFQNTDKLFGGFFMKRMPCFLCQLQLCTSACQHLGQDKPYTHVTASSLVT